MKDWSNSATTQDDTCFPLRDVYKAKTTAPAPAPTIAIQVTSSSGTKVIEVLPDSGADVHCISCSPGDSKYLQPTCWQLVSQSLGSQWHHHDFMGEHPSHFAAGQWTCEEDIPIYPGLSGAIISWESSEGTTHNAPPLSLPCRLETS